MKKQRPVIQSHNTVVGDKLLVRFYGQPIVTCNSRASADAVEAYLRSIDTGSRPGPARLDSIKARAATIAHAAAPNPSRGVARKAVRA